MTERQSNHLFSSSASLFDLFDEFVIQALTVFCAMTDNSHNGTIFNRSGVFVFSTTAQLIYLPSYFSNISRKW